MTEKPSTGDSASAVAFIHPSAVVDEGASVGPGTKIWHFCHVMAGAEIGADVVLGQNCFVGGGAIIGDGCRVQNDVSLFDGVVLEESVFCGPSVVFTNVLTPRAGVSRHREFLRTLVRRGATLGANCTVLCGRTIGEYAMVGAGAVVTHDVPAYRLAVGVPARFAGWACRCGEVLRFADGERPGLKAVCERCGQSYEIGDDAGLTEVDPP